MKNIKEIIKKVKKDIVIAKIKGNQVIAIDDKEIEPISIKELHNLVIETGYGFLKDNETKTIKIFK